MNNLEKNMFSLVTTYCLVTVQLCDLIVNYFPIMQTKLGTAKTATYEFTDVLPSKYKG